MMEFRVDGVLGGDGDLGAMEFRVVMEFRVDGVLGGDGVLSSVLLVFSILPVFIFSPNLAIYAYFPPLEPWNVLHLFFLSGDRLGGEGVTLRRVGSGSGGSRTTSGKEGNGSCDITCDAVKDEGKDTSSKSSRCREAAGFCCDATLLVLDCHPFLSRSGKPCNVPPS